MNQTESAVLSAVTLDEPWGLIESFATFKREHPDDVNRGMDEVVSRLREHGVHVSPRLIREKAHRTGNFYKIGRLMLLTPEHLEALIKSSQKATGQ